MRKIIFVLIGFTFFNSRVKADVIFAPYIDSEIALSLEGIGSYEFFFTKYNTINFWGGFGAVYDIERKYPPALGGEIAFELRHYFRKEKYRGFNLGYYTGISMMRCPLFHHGRIGQYNFVGLVPGVKLTYKYRLNSWLICEPYIGFSIPLFMNYFDNVCESIKYSYLRKSPVLTIGIRIGFNKVKNQK